MGQAKPFNILFVDDDSFTCDLLGSIIESAGHTVSTAANAMAALDTITSEKALDLLISDMNMPGMSGLELIRDLRARGSRMPIIILTGNNEISVAIEAMKCGASDYLLKDENIQDTIQIAIEKVMEKHRLEEENRQLLNELARKNEELRKIAFLDGLTGIANRRYFEEIGNREWRRAVREKQWIGVIMIDIDFFKLYNDTFGHQQGDDCLKTVAKTLDQSLRRPVDLIARYGGEEFIAILPNTNISGCMVVAETMREKLAGAKIPHPKSSVGEHVTISIGFGSVIPDRDLSFADFITRVDSALYSAKRDGRNRVKQVMQSISDALPGVSSQGAVS